MFNHATSTFKLLYALGRPLAIREVGEKSSPPFESPLTKREKEREMCRPPVCVVRKGYRGVFYNHTQSERERALEPNALLYCTCKENPPLKRGKAMGKRCTSRADSSYTANVDFMIESFADLGRLSSHALFAHCSFQIQIVCRWQV